mmetsp:Transcript_12197/g.17767  ORF Transcript_12197/g.17767 Transcript_12197/m.17767 type:complete len:267 (+) Transcript_12197:51-851(+)
MKCYETQALLSLIAMIMASHVQVVVDAFTPVPTKVKSFCHATSPMSGLQARDGNQGYDEALKKGVASMTFAAMLSLSTLNPQLAQAYDDVYDSYDSDADTVATVVKSLKETPGDAAASFKVFESINDIITEGKGVGGNINYKGVALERGYVADEDTTIYNPGLSLLTESEKDRIINAVIQNRKENLSKKTWSKDNEVAYDFLKTRLDPLHMVELRGYLGILPFYGAAVYLAALAVQQFSRDLFSGAYIASAAAIFLPIAVLIAFGP